MSFTRQLAAALFLLVASAPAATVQDFGFNTMGQNPNGTRPMLLLVAEFADTPARMVGNVSFPARDRNPIARTRDEYARFVFSSNPDPNLYQGRGINPYFRELSNQQFSWVSAANFPKRVFSVAETREMEEAITTTMNGNRYGLEGTVGCSYVVKKFLNDNPTFPIANFDTDNNSIVTTKELTVVIVCNWGIPPDFNGERSGANRGLYVPGVTHLALPFVPYSLQGRVAWLDHRTNLSTFTHEVSHSLDTVDIYNGNQPGQIQPNVYASQSSLMGGTISRTNDEGSAFHLDPWHKMKLGWLAPRLVPMSKGGGFVLRCAQSPGNEGPVLLYDDKKAPNQIPREFFMIEYRHTAPAVGIGYDAEGAGNGILIWHVATNADGTLSRRPDPTNPPNPANINGPWACLPEGRNATNNGFLFGGSVLDPSTQVWTQQFYANIPELRWFDGTATGVFLRPAAMGTTNSAFINIESNGETWAHFRPQAPEDGSFAAPWNTFVEGITDVGWAGRLRIKPGTSSETGTFNKKVTITAEGGHVTIGRQ